ncbi:DUF4091 domain-containing protein [Tundrisphaera sp. TA3]|uniref:DUF4091 domain-containing protein n=1 Tax=Tundrisphaera sp. TA3 TaxID=3435775 RepID=UPI003EB99A9E
MTNHFRLVAVLMAFTWVGSTAHAEPAPKGPISVEIGPSKARASCWLAPSVRRVYPATRPGSAELSLLAARNGKVSFQVCVRNESRVGIGFDCSLVGADDLKPRVRQVGLVPLGHVTPNTDLADLEGAEHGPGLVPDPLLPESRVLTGPDESRSFWVSLRIPPDATPGPRTITARLMPFGGTEADRIELPVALEIAPLVIQPRRDFPVIHWWRGEATWDQYQTGMFDDRWFDLTRAQLENMLDHGSDVVYVPMFFDRRETFRRPCQLLIVEETSPGVYKFDWSRVKKFTDLCKQIGFTRFEWSHLWIYWGAENPVRVYTADGPDKFRMLWPPEISGFSETFLGFLRQFLPEFKAFLDREGLLETSYFHLSDEPGEGQHIANYKKARQILRDLAPWMKVMDALSDIEYGRQGLTDQPIPLVSSAQAYIDAKIPHWVYYCCAPRGPWINRFLDTPLTKIRASGWLFYRLGARGFLHWGFNYWHRLETETLVDPFRDASAGLYPLIPYGDPFVIYPGPDGPIDSIRWEVFAESLQDYAILQTAGISPDDPLLAEFKTYAEFPRGEEWLQKALERVLKGTNSR